MALDAKTSPEDSSADPSSDKQPRRRSTDSRHGAVVPESPPALLTELEISGDELREVVRSESGDLRTAFQTFTDKAYVSPEMAENGSRFLVHLFSGSAGALQRLISPRLLTTELQHGCCLLAQFVGAHWDREQDHRALTLLANTLLERRALLHNQVAAEFMIALGGTLAVRQPTLAQQLLDVAEPRFAGAQDSALLSEARQRLAAGQLMARLPVVAQPFWQKLINGAGGDVDWTLPASTHALSTLAKHLKSEDPCATLFRRQVPDELWKATFEPASAVPTRPADNKAEPKPEKPAEPKTSPPTEAQKPDPVPTKPEDKAKDTSKDAPPAASKPASPAEKVEPVKKSEPAQAKKEPAPEPAKPEPPKTKQTEPPPAKSPEPTKAKDEKTQASDPGKPAAEPEKPKQDAPRPEAEAPKAEQTTSVPAPAPAQRSSAGRWLLILILLAGGAGAYYHFNQERVDRAIAAFNGHAAPVAPTAQPSAQAPAQPAVVPAAPPSAPAPVQQVPAPQPASPPVIAPPAEPAAKSTAMVADAPPPPPPASFPPAPDPAASATPEIAAKAQPSTPLDKWKAIRTQQIINSFPDLRAWHVAATGSHWQEARNFMLGNHPSAPRRSPAHRALLAWLIIDPPSNPEAARTALNTFIRVAPVQECLETWEPLVAGKAANSDAIRDSAKILLELIETQITADQRRRMDLLIKGELEPLK